MKWERRRHGRSGDGRRPGALDLRAVFERIFTSNAWGAGESRSGPGSNLTRTSVVRAALPALLGELGVRTMVDAPCGDHHWLAAAKLELDTYLGIDIVPELVARNRARYARPGVEFEVADLTREPPPAADLILCRDLLGHLSFADGLAVVAGFRRSGARWLLATTFARGRRNADIASGGWRRLSLELPPYGFPPPSRLVRERSTEIGALLGGKCLGLWRLADLP